MSLQDTPTQLSPKDFKYLEVGYAFGEDGFSRNHFGTKDIIPDFRKKQNNIGLYRTSYWYNTKDPYTSSLFGSFYMDFDSEEDIELAREDILFVIWKFNLSIGFNLPMSAFRIYFSGKKGFHLIIPWQYLGIQPDDKLDEFFRWLAEDLKEETPNKTVDMVVYERRRLFRLEHSIHQRTGLYKIPLQYHELVNLSIKEIEALATENRVLQYERPHFIADANKQYKRYVEEYKEFLTFQKKTRPKTPTYTKGVVPEPVQELIDQGPAKGIRNESAAALTSFWNNQGYDEDEIFGLLLDWNDGSLPERELKTTMKSILKRDLTYGLNRFKSLLEGDVGRTNEERNAFREYKKRGR